MPYARRTVSRRRSTVAPGSLIGKVPTVDEKRISEESVAPQNPGLRRTVSLRGGKASRRRAMTAPGSLVGKVPLVDEARISEDLVAPQNPGLGLPAVYNHGGAVASGVPIILIFWGSVWQQPGIVSLAQSLDAAARRLASGTFFTGLQEYGITPPHIGDSIVVTDPQPPANYDQSNIEDMVNDLIKGGTYPEPDEPGGRNLYVVFMPPGTTGPGGITGAHNYFNSGSVIDVDHTWYAFVEYGSLNTMTRSFGHEVVEACTDPELDAWYDDNGPEIGDVCNQRQGWCDGVWVEYYWSHQQVACILPSRVAAVNVIHARSEQGDVSLYNVGTDGRVWSNFWPAAAGSIQWNGWFPIGDNTFPQGSPVTSIHSRSDDGAVSLYVVGTDGRVWSNFWPAAAGSSQWSGWFPIGDNTFPQRSQVSAIHPRLGEGAVSLYVVGTDGQVWSNFWPAAEGSIQWSGWLALGPNTFPIGSPVSVIHSRSGEGAVGLYVIGTDGQVWSNFWPAVEGSIQWSGWFALGPNTFPVGSPVSVIHPRSGEGTVSLYVIGTDGQVWSNFWPAAAGSIQWSGWFALGPNTFPVGSSVSVIHPRSDEGAVSLYAVGVDGRVWSNFWPAAAGSIQWSGWFPIGDNTFPI